MRVSVGSPQGTFGSHRTAQELPRQTGRPAIYNLASQELEHPDGWKEPLHWLEESFKSDRRRRAQGFFNRRWDLVQVFMTASGW
jgi:hypothetical protein